MSSQDQNLPSYADEATKEAFLTLLKVQMRLNDLIKEVGDAQDIMAPLENEDENAATAVVSIMAFKSKLEALTYHDLPAAYRNVKR